MCFSAQSIYQKRNTFTHWVNGTLKIIRFKYTLEWRVRIGKRCLTLWMSMRGGGLNWCPVEVSTIRSCNLCSMGVAFWRKSINALYIIPVIFTENLHEIMCCFVSIVGYISSTQQAHGVLTHFCRKCVSNQGDQYTMRGLFRWIKAMWVNSHCADQVLDGIVFKNMFILKYEFKTKCPFNFQVRQPLIKRTNGHVST